MSSPPRLIHPSVERYFPPRSDCTLFLSGGGFRAAAFHLGTVSWLYESGVLPFVSHVRATSGGALLAAWMHAHAVPLHSRNVDMAWFNDCFAAPLCSFLERDLRTRPILLSLPVNWCYKHLRGVLLRREIARLFVGMNRVESSPVEYRAVAFDLRSNRVVELEFGVHETELVVGASASFPPVFGPVRVGDMLLVDGGIAANLGLTAETLRATVGLLVSDAGKRRARWKDAAHLPYWLKVALVAFDGANRALRDAVAAVDSDHSVVAVAPLCADPWIDHQPLAEGIGSRDLAGTRTDLAGFTAGRIVDLRASGYATAQGMIAPVLEAWGGRVASGDDAVTPPSSDFAAYLAQLVK